MGTLNSKKKKKEEKEYQLNKGHKCSSQGIVVKVYGSESECLTNVTVRDRDLLIRQFSRSSVIPPQSNTSTTNTAKLTSNQSLESLEKQSKPVDRNSTFVPTPLKRSTIKSAEPINNQSFNKQLPRAFANQHLNTQSQTSAVRTTELTNNQSLDKQFKTINRNFTFVPTQSKASAVKTAELTNNQSLKKHFPKVSGNDTSSKTMETYKQRNQNENEYQDKSNISHTSVERFAQSGNLNKSLNHHLNTTALIMNNLSQSTVNTSKRNAVCNEKCNTAQSKDNETVGKYKQELFMKKLVSNFNLKSYQRSGRGYYCDLCNIFEVHYRRTESPVYHDRSEQHLTKLQNVKPNSIKRYSCASCNALFFGDMKFWVDHTNTVYHQMMQKQREEWANTRSRSRSRNAKRKNVKPTRNNFNPLPSLSLMDVLSSQEVGNDDVSDSNSESSSEESKLTKDITTKEDKKKQKLNFALLVTDLPARTSIADIVRVFKDFNPVNNVDMNINGPHTAKVVFKFRQCAQHLVNNKVPIYVKGELIKISLLKE